MISESGIRQLKVTDKTDQSYNKYVLLDLIGTGGMAEVYRAKLIGQRGFEKPLVIKQLLAEVAGNAEVVENFIDEARLAALLQHENIACVYDFGEQDGSYFIAMEYLFGKDLHSVMGQAKSSGGTVGVSLSLYIVAQICAGMDYAHTLIDMQQQPLHIIHRDLTPHNVFLTYEGKIKIIDFGVAQAELFDNRTRAGVIKGKVSYMSPEQLIEGDVDARSDIFSIGILLYEMLSGVRMYQGDTATLIRKCINVEYLPIEEVLQDLDPAVCEILHKALEKDKEDRYKSCGEMLDDINDYFFKQGLRPSNKEVKILLFDLFRADYETEIQRLVPDEIAKTTTTTGEPLGDDDKTVIVGSPYAKIRFVNKIMGSRGALLVGLPTVISVVVLVVVYMVFTGSRATKNATFAGIFPQSVVNIQPLLVPVELEKEINDEDIMARAVEILLGKAEKALAENKLTVPRGDSAFTYYKNVLELDPENSAARDGMGTIAEMYAIAAEKKLSENDVRAAGERIKKGLGVMATNVRLLTLQRQIAHREQAEIDALLAKAKIAFAANRYTRPAANCAYHYYQAINRIRPGSLAVKKGLLAIADRYARMGDKALQNLNLTKARRVVALGLGVMPQHPGLLELQDDLQKSKPAIFVKGLIRSLRPLFQ
ncbi:MAG: hypothetical protein COA36_05690 [Desulfotalea sp.]|nr:MAG: hypothetical protein COA36_05690 [Desulfotalea sp.]